jgi:acylphosphatase
MTVCKRVVYSGRVQGVGFRYTARGLARRFSVAGYVRNLADGSVELVVEGEAEQVNAFLGAVADQMGDYIRDSTVRDESPGNYRGFEIRF